MISIIVPIYNGENYIDRCVESLLKQDSNDWEALLIDDGSADNSLNICRKWADKFPSKLSTYHQNNCGQIAARQLGIKHAKGNYCMFLDCDDSLVCNAVSTIDNLIDHYLNVDIIIFDAIRKYPEKIIPFFEHVSTHEVLFKKSDFLKQVVKSQRFNNICFKAIKTKILKDNIVSSDFSEVNVEEDLLMQLKYFDYASTIIYIPKYLYVYYFNENSVTNTFNKNRYISSAYLHKYLSQYAKKWKLNAEEYLDQKFFIDEISSLRQLKKSDYSFNRRKDYIFNLATYEYFQKMYQNKSVKLNFKRETILKLIYKKKITILTLLTYI